MTKNSRNRRSRLRREKEIQRLVNERLAMFKPPDFYVHNHAEIKTLVFGDNTLEENPVTGELKPIPIDFVKRRMLSEIANYIHKKGFIQWEEFEGHLKASVKTVKPSIPQP